MATIAIIEIEEQKLFTENTPRQYFTPRWRAFSKWCYI